MAERWLVVARGDEAISPPGIAIHGTDRQGASSSRQFFAGIGQELLPRRGIDRRIVTDESYLVTRVMQRLLPPERTTSHHSPPLVEQDPVRVGGVANEIRRVERRQIRVGDYAVQFGRFPDFK